VQTATVVVANAAKVDAASASIVTAAGVIVVIAAWLKESVWTVQNAIEWDAQAFVVA